MITQFSKSIHVFGLSLLLIFIILPSCRCHAQREITEKDYDSLFEERGIIFYEDKYGNTIIYKVTKPTEVMVLGTVYEEIKPTLRFLFGDFRGPILEIPEIVSYKDKNFIVTSIKDSAFIGNKNIEQLYLPYTLESIGTNSFGQCKKLNTVHGLRRGLYIEKSFWATPLNESDFKRWTNVELHYNEIKYRLYQWCKKREFETTEQYLERTKEENRFTAINKITHDVMDSIVKFKLFYPVLNIYDADNETFKISSLYGEKYVHVPIDEAPHFKNFFSSAYFKVSFLLTNSGIVIDSMSVFLNGKTYLSKNNSEYNTLVYIPDLNDLNITLNQNDNKRTEVRTDNTIDVDIPALKSKNKETFSIIIGNEHYQRVSKVPYANNDAKIFAEYCRKTLGIPDKNVRMYENATYGTMIGAMNDLQKIAKAFKGDINVVFYYAGHGIPNETTGDAYLLPVDADGMNTEVCYSLSRLYKELGELGVRRTIVFMDACFSGAERGNGMVVAARGVVIKPKTNQPTGNTIVFSAATGKQAAYPYEEKGHGLFTYYLLKKLHDTKGDVTLGELGSYICDEAAKQAVLNKGKEQTPMVLTPMGMGEEWKNWKLRE